jgi:Transcriptional regulators of sugar metabolism
MIESAGRFYREITMVYMDRLQLILGKLQEKNVLSVRTLAEQLNVSEMTIRRDISILEKDNRIETFYGGVSLKQTELAAESFYEIENELIKRTEQKERIARKAASLINQNDVILIDTGSTTGSIVKYINNSLNLIVYCYALNIINGLCMNPNLTVVACGGYFHSNTKMFESQEGASLIRKTVINKAFLAARGISEEVGITTAEPYEVEMKKAAISVSEQKILLADSTKLGKAWYAKYADLSDINVVITDDEADEKYVNLLQKMNITVYIV